MIARLLKDGHHPDTIAYITGTSQTVVAAVARNPPSRVPLYENIAWRPYFNPETEKAREEFKGLFEPCPTCGHDVILPCVACGARAYLNERPLSLSPRARHSPSVQPAR